ncbi:MAG: 50S ribosomal protein L11 methyltransferase [Thermoproteota archaeon]
MILPTIGLSRRRRLPCLHYFGSTFLPWQKPFLSLFLSSFGWTYDGSTLKNGKVTILCPFKEHARMIVNEWKLWKKYYLPPFSLKGKTVLDAGAGVGETAIFYALHGAKKIYAVEIDKEKAKLISKNAKLNNVDVEVFTEPFSVKHLALPFDFAKIDVEGAETELLKLEKINFPCLVETHSKEIEQRFIRRGFRKVYEFDDKDISLVVNYAYEKIF